MEEPAFDVAIVGGGPAGAAMALSLLQHEKSLAIAVFEEGAAAEHRIGESLSPLARRFLAHLAVLDLLEADGAVASHGSAASWGSDELTTNEFLHGAHGSGWQLDRCRFDAGLLERVEQRGAVRERETRVQRVRRDPVGWTLQLSSGASRRARFVVDATGRRASVARSLGAHCEVLDRMVGIYGFFGGDGVGDPRTVVEATADGWWYTAGVPNGTRVVVFMTDRDIAVAHGLQRAESWRQALDQTRHVAERVVAGAMVRPPLVRATESKRCEPACGSDWVAVGDAASTYDPLSSQGIAKALQSGIFASYAVADCLARSDHSGLDRYRRYVDTEFERYEKARLNYYLAEGRWPESEFWKRRRSPATNGARTRVRP